MLTASMRQGWEELACMLACMPMQAMLRARLRHGWEGRERRAHRYAASPCARVARCRRSFCCSSASSSLRLTNCAPSTSRSATAASAAPRSRARSCQGQQEQQGWARTAGKTAPPELPPLLTSLLAQPLTCAAQHALAQELPAQSAWHQPAHCKHTQKMAKVYPQAFMGHSNSAPARRL